MKKAYVVLGMHRSGTSSVAGVLALLGAAPPKTLMGPAADNPKGFWESYAVSDLNDRILATVGSSWSDWRSFPPQAAQAFIEQGVEVLRSEFGGAAGIVLKDPRICRLYPFWGRVLEAEQYSPMVVVPIRRPAEVQASLGFRNAMPEADSRKLWLRHVLDAELFSRGQPRLILLWSDFLENWRRQISKVECFGPSGLKLGDPTAADQIAEFLSPDLQHHRESEAPPEAKLEDEVFAAFSLIAREGESPVLLERLDGLRRRFEADQNA